jgi:two-component system, chemotaxis family, chemotaxis protein CheY
MDKIRALIVDDSSVMREIVERSLRQAGIDLDKAVEASNSAEALIALQNNVVDLILRDINMPVMDGLEFIRQVHTVESAKGVDIVILGYTLAADSLAQAGIQAQTPLATPDVTPPATKKTAQPSPAAALKPAVVRNTGDHLQQ